MAGFRKAKPQQAAIKLGMYGPAGSGKTFTSLLIAEGLAQATGKRIAFVDTEHGSDFYCAAVRDRRTHPGAFDFDALYTRSITETLQAVQTLRTSEYGVVVIDSITHLWEACIAAYGGRQTSAGTIPMHAWGKIKKPYKDLMTILLSSPLHVILCGRQGTEYATDEETEELKAVGVKMKAEGETPYEPHILIRMEAVKPRKTNEIADILAYVEKDRTGVLAGRTFVNPTYGDMIAPILGLLGETQAALSTTDATAAADSERIEQADREREAESAKLLRELSAKIDLAETAKDLKSIGAKITPQLKSRMLLSDVSALRDKYLSRERAMGPTSTDATSDEDQGQPAGNDHGRLE